MLGFGLLAVRYEIAITVAGVARAGGLRVRETLLCITAVRSSVQLHLPESRQDP